MILMKTPNTRQAGKSKYKRTAFTVAYASLDEDSPFIEAITDSDLEIGDIVFYNAYSSAGKKVRISSTGIVTIYDQTADDTITFWIEDSSSSFSKVGPATITLDIP